MGSVLSRSAARLGVVLAATVVGCLVAAPARAQDPGLQLQLSTSRGSYVLGERVPLQLTVTNRTGAACQVAAVADGALRVASLTRDGVAVAPTYAEVRYSVSLAEQARDGLKDLGPNAAAGVATAAVSTGEGGRSVTLTTVDALPGGGGGIATAWAIDAPGRYRLTASFAPPPIGQRPCAGATGEASVEFTVTAAAPAGKSTRWWWWLVAGGAAVVLLGVLAWLVVRRRGAAAAVIVAVLVAGGVVTGSRPVHAEVVGTDDSLELQLELGKCMGIFRAPGGDPAKILPVVDTKPGPKIIVKPRVVSGDPDSFTGNKKTGEQTVRWSPRPDGRLLEPGVPSDPCAELYHELAHAKDYNSPGGLDKRGCDNLFVETAEARATFAENAYRASRKPKLPVRQTYSGLTLPKKLEDCEKRPDTAQKGKPTECTAAASGAGGDTQCDDEVPPEPPPGPPPAMTNGDPHLRTLDQRTYDFQAVGEFTDVVSDSGDLVIQTRQAPVEGSRSASVNTAVALQVGADRLQLAAVRGTIAVWLNGQPVTWTKGARILPGGAKAARRASPITFGQDGYTLRWSDGSRVWVDLIGAFGLRLYVTLAPARKGAVRGLLGAFDGDPANDLRPRDGQPLTGEITRQGLYRTFGDSWRVDTASSLFVYGRGENTQTFTDRTFPDQLVGVADLDPARRAAAQEICTAAGVTDPAQLADCVLDVAVTGRAAFAVNSADVQTNRAVAAAAAATGPGATTPVGGTLRDGAVVSGQLTAGGQANRYTVDTGGVTDFFVADWRGATDACEQAFTVNLVDVSTGNSPCTGQSVRFHVPDPGRTYQVEILSPKGATGAYRFTIVTQKPRTLAARLGERVTGALDVRGREDRYEFATGGATQLRLTDLPDCSTGMQIELYDVTDARTISGGRLLCGDIRYTLDSPTHRYAVVITSYTLGTGAYTFTVATG
jgi:VWD domain-containing protein